MPFCQCFNIQAFHMKFLYFISPFLDHLLLHCSQIGFFFFFWSLAGSSPPLSFMLVLMAPLFFFSCVYLITPHLAVTKRIDILKQRSWAEDTWEGNSVYLRGSLFPFSSPRIRVDQDRSGWFQTLSSLLFLILKGNWRLALPAYKSAAAIKHVCPQQRLSPCGILYNHGTCPTY